MAKVVLVIKDSTKSLFEFEIKGLEDECEETPAILAGHAAAGYLRRRQTALHEKFLSQILRDLSDQDF
ncbi:hypothetical protein [Neisseria iguanae]|uniref:Uncharacterized protein n=1 Tax=Neisseria iguanae TaxID=90242 RepID=A0A2P7U1N8_9NEIS|nr:hypothetical protein [Neisseria iguanae]PSJ80879.1 hypothetical protein C7N83_03635 [Neisseria iguanae]